jgi:glycerophosphoryl diester phosphodiesterase
MPLHRVAHRGYSAVAPENTLPALRRRVLAGATLIEFDVRTTADGVPVVIHDRTVDRTTTAPARSGS